MQNSTYRKMLNLKFFRILYSYEKLEKDFNVIKNVKMLLFKDFNETLLKILFCGQSEKFSFAL